MKKFFEKKLEKYNCKFDLLDELVEKQEEASNYYAWVRDNYKKYFIGADSLTKSKFCIRYYRAKKLLYSSVKMLIEAKCSLENECIVGYYYLIYYALFQAIQANLIICIHYDDNKVIQLTHENVKIYFDEEFCKNKKCPLDDEIISLIEDLRKFREYYSYAMPFNLSDKAIIDMDKVEYYISICIQLFNLHCFIIRNDVTKSIEFDYINEDEIEQYFKQACNRLGYDCFTDEADKNFWNEYKHIGGMDIMPPSLTFSHDFDEFGTYDSDVYEAMRIQRTQRLIARALSFFYDTIGGI